MLPFLQTGGAVPPETADFLKVAGPYITALLTALGTVAGYGALKARVEAWAGIRKEDNDAHDAAETRLTQELAAAEARFQAELRRQREDFQRELAALREADGNLQKGINRVDTATREQAVALGRIQGAATAAVDAQRQRIDLHAKRNDTQQTQNAEYFAREAREARDAAEKALRELRTLKTTGGGNAA